jgi:RNA polymerase sigma-70 factor (ECF subfamily)
MPSTSAPPAAIDAQPAALTAARERLVVRALRSGDEGAFTALVERYGGVMRRIARSYVASDAIADELVQETWVAVLAGLDRFEERSSLRTWMFRILINRAKTQGARDSRFVPLSSLDTQDEGPVVAADRFFGPDARNPGHWCAPPRPWQQPETHLLSLETRARLREALQQLPARQRVVVTMRDVEGMDADEVRELLDLSPENQRVLLHRGRSHLRNMLERYVASAAN